MSLLSRWLRHPSQKFVLRNSLGIFLILTTLCSVRLSVAGPFEVNKEFPNHFLGQPGVEEKVQVAMQAVLKRLDLPYMHNGNVVTTGFFKELKAQIQERSPGASVSISGGVVRSILGYIYQEVHKKKDKKGASTIETLDAIIRDTKPLSTLKVLGIGSDLDILVAPAPGHESTLEAVKQVGTTFINSTETAMGLRDMTTPLKRALVPVGDVKGYDDQITRAYRQGGSRLDLLAFDLDQGKVKNPPQSKINIFQEFLSGYYDYAPPEKKEFVEDEDKQTIRGLRAMLELPFLQLTPAGEAQLYQDLQGLIERVRTGGKLSEQALQQLKKMELNARFGGANNRIFRSEDSIGQSLRHLIDGLRKVNAEGVSEKRLFPEFLSNTPLSAKPPKEFPQDLLMNPRDFKTDYTAHGTLYHGTRQEHALAAIRNGIFLSDQTKGQGVSVHGRGSYTTGDFNTACTYAQGADGCVIQIEVKDDPQLRVVDLARISTDPRIKAMEQAAKEAGKDLHAYLADEYGIHIIVNGYPLIQNASAVKVPKDVRSLIRIHVTGLERRIQNYAARRSSGENLIASFFQYRELFKLAKAIDQAQGLKPFAEVTQDLLHALGVPADHLPPETSPEFLTALSDRILSTSDPKIKKSFLTSLPRAGQNEHLAYLSYVRRLIRDPDEEVRKAALHLLLNLPPWIDKNLSAPRQAALHFYEQLLKEPNAEKKRELLKNIGDFFQTMASSENSYWIQPLLDHPDPEFHIVGIRSISGLYEEPRKKAIQQFIHSTNVDEIRALIPAVASEVNAQTHGNANVHTLPAKEGEEFMRRVLTHPSASVRIAAADNISLYNGSDKEDLIQNLIDDPEVQKSEGTLATLYFFQKRSQTKDLKKVFLSAAPTARIGIIMKMYPDLNPLAVFNHALFKGDSEIQFGVLDTLVELGGLASCFKTITIEISGSKQTPALSSAGIGAKEIAKLWQLAANRPDERSRAEAKLKFKECYGREMPEKLASTSTSHETDAKHAVELFDEICGILQLHAESCEE